MWENLQDEIRAELGGNLHEGNFAMLFDLQSVSGPGSRAGQIGMRVMSHRDRTSPEQQARMAVVAVERDARYVRYRAALAEYPDRSQTVGDLARKHDVDVFKLTRLAVLRGLSRGRSGKRTAGGKSCHIAALAAYQDLSLTVAEVCRRYGLSTVTLYRLAKEAGLSRPKGPPKGRAAWNKGKKS
jgi:hypothetical protein